MVKWIVGIVAVTIAGCATSPPIGTLSGNPEIMLSNVRPDCVKAGLLNAFINGGYKIESANDYQIVGGKPTTNTLAALMLGTRLNSTVEERFTVTMAPQANSSDLRLVVDGAYVSNPGTAFEEKQPMKAGGAIQQQFVSAKARIESKCAKS
jgi:hypothetical protein